MHGHSVMGERTRQGVLSVSREGGGGRREGGSGGGKGRRGW